MRTRWMMCSKKEYSDPRKPVGNRWESCFRSFVKVHQRISFETIIWILTLIRTCLTEWRLCRALYTHHLLSLLPTSWSNTKWLAAPSRLTQVSIVMSIVSRSKTLSLLKHWTTRRFIGNELQNWGKMSKDKSNLTRRSLKFWRPSLTL